MKEASEPKKLALLYLLRILEEESDEGHPLTQEALGALLAERHGILLERKAVGRNLALLSEAGYDILHTSGGYYLGERLFEPGELRLLIDSVLFSRHINPTQSRALADKLSSLGGRHFSAHRNHVAAALAAEGAKNAQSQLFYAIEVADEAIERSERISFTYNKYGPDKRLHKSSEHIVSPYRMILQNQHYYLMGYTETHGKMAFFRMDKMTSVTLLGTPAVPLRTLPGYEAGLDDRELATGLPYMVAERPVPITFTSPAWLIDQVIDWFGKSAEIRENGGEEGEYLVTVRASAGAMEYWALQYARYIRILSPADLRDRVAAILRAAADGYAKIDG